MILNLLIKNENPIYAAPAVKGFITHNIDFNREYGSLYVYNGVITLGRRLTFDTHWQSHY